MKEEGIMTVGGRLYQSSMLYQLTAGENIEPLLKKGARANQILMDGLNSTPLHVAVDCNNIASVKTLIKYGSDLNCSSKGGYTPLMKAMKMGNMEIIDVLIAAGAYLNSKDDFNRTALWWASYYGQSNILSYMVKKGAHLNVVDTQKGLTPLMVAAKYSDNKTVEALLGCGASVNDISYRGHTALIYAILDKNKMQGFLKAKALIQSGADIHSSHLGVLNTFSPRPLMVAVEQQNETLLKLLLLNGAKGMEEGFLYAKKRNYTEIMSVFKQFDLPSNISKNVKLIDLKITKDEPLFVVDNQIDFSYSIKNNKLVRQKM